MDKGRLLERINFLLEKGKTVLKTEKKDGMYGRVVDPGLQSGFRTASLSFIKNLYGEDHIYYKDIFSQSSNTNWSSDTERCINILDSVKEEIEGDWLFDIQSLVAADIFSDFLEMSEHLLEQGYKDPAAVLIGSTLESHISNLCEKHDIPVTIWKGDGKLVPIKADQLNADLKKNGVYGTLEQKNVTSWLDLRNKAAHGKYDEYTKEQVEIVLLGVQNFILSHK
ncbi:MAG: hypothetical protein KDC84_08750 [Crocinitomicaceae bacterium]|nr:hypothetical protein [Crocinitomicaceae bacterium]